MIYFSIADKYLFDKINGDKTNVKNTWLLGGRYSSKSELITDLGSQNKRTMKRAMKTYASADPISKSYVSSADFLKSYFGDKYIIEYETKDNGYINVIKKMCLTNEDLEKYMILCS